MNFLLRLLTVILLLPVTVAFADPVGRVQFVAGIANIEPAGRAVRPLQKGDTIEEGDAVITGRQGQAQLLMFDDAIIAVRPDTRLLFETYRYSGKPDGMEQGVMALVRGGFRTITGFIGRARPSAYRVKTPTATIGVRGTDHEPLYIPPPGPGETPIGPPGTYNKVNSGQTFIENASGRIEIGPNQAGFAPPTPNIAPVRLPQIPAFMRGTPPVGSEGAKRGARDGERRGQGQKEAANKQDQQEQKAQGGQDTAVRNDEASGTTQATGQSQASGSGSSAGSGTEASPAPAGSMPPAGNAQGTTQGGAQASATGGLATSGGSPLAASVPAPVPALIKGTLDLTKPPSESVVAPKGFAVTGGDLSAGAVGSGAGIVGDNFGVVLDASGNPLSVAGNNSSYSRAGAPLIQQGSTSLAGIPVRWGIYAGGQFSDERGVRSPSFFHFMGAPNATPPAVLIPVSTASGPMTFTALPGNNEYTKPIAENGAVGGRVGLSITLNNISSIPSVTAYNLSVVDANGRNWIAGLAGGPVGLGTFLKSPGAQLNVGCNGCPLPSGFGSAQGAAIGSTAIQGVISSYDLRAGKAGVTGSVLAR